MSTNQNSTQQSDSTTQHITPSQRAAVVIAMLGETAAKPIVELLDDRAIANIATSLESISVLAREQLIEIVIASIDESHTKRHSTSVRIDLRKTGLQLPSNSANLERKTGMEISLN